MHLPLLVVVVASVVEESASAVGESAVQVALVAASVAETQSGMHCQPGRKVLEHKKMCSEIATS